MQLELYTVPGGEHNEAARKELKKLQNIPGVSIREGVCPPGTDEVYIMPVVAVDTDLRVPGIGSIRRFVSRTLAKHAGGNS